MAHQEYSQVQDQQQVSQIQQIQNPIYYQSQPQHQIPHYDNTTAISKICKEKTEKHCSDRVYSLAFLILGIFTFFPFLVNIIYLRSPIRQARIYAFASIIIGTCYLLAQTIIWSISYGNLISEETNMSYNNGYNAGYSSGYTAGINSNN